MGKLILGVKEGEDTPFFKFENNIGNETSLEIMIGNCDVKGTMLANIMDPLKEQLEQGIHLKDITVTIEAKGPPAKKGLLFYCLYAIISVIPSIPVNSLLIGADLLEAECCLDNALILQLLKDNLLHPKSSLQYLELSRLTFNEDMSLDILGKMLSHPDCRLKGFSFRDSSIPNIGRWIKNYLGNTRLELLDLINIQEGLDDAAAVELGEVLKNHPTLKFLDAWCLFDVTNEGAKAIAEALKTNTVLKYLNFTNANIGEAALIKFAEALKYSKLEALILDVGEVFTPESEAPLDESAIAFGEAFKVNNTLVYFSLYRQEPTEAGAEALRQGILQNQSLQFFATSSDTDEEFNCILDKNKHTRKKHNLLWTIWEEYGDLPSPEQSIQDVPAQSADERPVQIQCPSVFAGGEFFWGDRGPFFTTAKGDKCEIYWEQYAIKIARALDFFESATPALEVELPAASASAIDYTSYFQWLPREMVEDTLSLPLSEDEIRKEKERQRQPEVRERFWQELLEPAAKRRKIEGEEATPNGKSSTANRGLFN